MTVEGVKITFASLSAREALVLDKQLTGQLLKGLSGTSLDPKKLTKKNSSALDAIMSLDIGSLAEGVGEVIAMWEENAFFDFSLRLLKGTQIVKKGKPPFEIDNEADFNETFSGIAPIEVYKVLIEAMKVNSFSVFKLGVILGIGDVIKQMHTTDEEKEKETEITPNSEV